MFLTDCHWDGMGIVFSYLEGRKSYGIFGWWLYVPVFIVSSGGLKWVGPFGYGKLAGCPIFGLPFVTGPFFFKFPLCFFAWLLIKCRTYIGGQGA